MKRSFISLIALITAAAGCGSSTAMNPLGPAPSPQACRTYATEWTSTSTFGAPITHSASWSSSDRTYTEFVPAGSSQVARRTTYASVADFIDEPGVVGRSLYMRRDACQGNVGCTGALPASDIATYDSSRRQTGLQTQINGTVLLLEIYTAWDGQGRPVGGSRAQPGLCTIPVVLAYDDGARTMSETPTGAGTGILCLGVLTTSARTFDANGNVISETGSAGGTTTTTTSTITATAQVCK